MLCPPIPYFLSERKFIYRNFEIFIHILEQRGSLLLCCRSAPTDSLHRCLSLAPTPQPKYVFDWIIYKMCWLFLLLSRSDPSSIMEIRYVFWLFSWWVEKVGCTDFGPRQVEKLANATDCTWKIRSMIKAICNGIYLIYSGTQVKSTCRSDFLFLGMMYLF